ncbi:MAG: hypothetical protein LC687_05525 [Actinobacteria bacterium]|nr:hypothetical protein [Actinomycetota bacterium]
MSTIIPIHVINQFLPNDKLELESALDGQTQLPVDWPLVAELVVTARDIVVSKMSTRYNTSTWFDSDTPSLMMNVAGMLVAGWVYNRQFSEEAVESSSYGNQLIEQAYRMLDSALGGTSVVEGAEFTTDSATQSATFEPTEPVFLITERF